MEYNNYAHAITFDKYLSRTYLSIALGLGVSALFAYGFMFAIPYIINFYFGIMMGVTIATLGIAIYFSAALRKMTSRTAWICYILYSALTGVSLSSLLLYYANSSVVAAFLTTAIVFVCMAVIGNTTHLDLSKYGSLFFVGLISLLIFSVVDMLFLHTSGFVIAFVGIILFLGLVAYDMQMLRRYYEAGSYDEEAAEKMMIFGAFQLYLDFINIFIRVLQIFGRKRD